MKIEQIDVMAGDVEAFSNVRRKIYADQVRWIPTSLEDDLSTFSSDNPFFNHAQIQAFLAIKHGNVIGRICAILDEKLSQPGHAKVGFFGFFECVNNNIAAKLLMQSAEQWLRERKASQIQGPLSLSIYHGYRMQIRGFDTTPFLSEPRNPAYYPYLIADNGYRIKACWRSWDFDQQDLHQLYEETMKGIQSYTTNTDISYKIETVDLERFKEFLAELHPTALSMISKNYGYACIDQEEFVYCFRKLQQILQPGCFQLTRDDTGQIIAFVYGYPDTTPKSESAVLPRYILYFTGVVTKYRITDLVYHLISAQLDIAIGMKGEAVGALAKEGKTIYDKIKKPSRMYAIYEKAL